MDCFERWLVANGSTGFIVGNHLTIADLKLYWIIDWLTMGILDGIPKELRITSYNVCYTKLLRVVTVEVVEVADIERGHRR